MARPGGSLAGPSDIEIVTIIPRTEASITVGRESRRTATRVRTSAREVTPSIFVLAEHLTRPGAAEAIRVQGVLGSGFVHVIEVVA